MVLEGKAEIVRIDNDVETTIASFGPGAFLGELSLLTGQRPYLTARIAEPGRVRWIPRDDFRRLMSEKPDIADVIFSAFSARRERLREGDGARAIRIVGTRYSSEAMALRAFATRSHLPHTWIDLEDAPDPDVLLAGMGLRPADTPAVITPTAVLRKPSPGEFAEHLGLTFQPIPGILFDLVVVGPGPPASPLPSTAPRKGSTPSRLDAFAIGGQAGASSRIENYAGFPNGISGEDLVSRTAIQAQRLGARLNAPCVAPGCAPSTGFMS